MARSSPRRTTPPRTPKQNRKCEGRTPHARPTFFPPPSGSRSAKLFLFRAITVPTDPAPDDYTIAPASYGHVLEKRALADLELSVKTIAPGLFAGYDAKLGVAWEAICSPYRHDGGEDRDHADRTVVVVRAAHRLAA